MRATWESYVDAAARLGMLSWHAADALLDLMGASDLRKVHRTHVDKGTALVYGHAHGDTILLKPTSETAVT